MNDFEKLQGTLKQIGYERDGVKKPTDEQGWHPCVTFSGNAFVVTLADGSIPIKGTFKIDSTCQPKAIDFTDTFGADAGKTFLAIYSLEDDQLVFCAADAGLDRPTEFSTKLGYVLRVNERDQ